MPGSESLLSPGSFDLIQEQLPPLGNCADIEMSQVLQQQVYQPLVHLNKLPMTDLMDTDYAFNIELNSESASKTSWMFSTKLNKVFVKINTYLNVHASYTNVDENQQLFVRAMIVYTSANDLAEPVKKCPNHREQSGVEYPEHILRCAMSQSPHYVGTEFGKFFKDKLAILIPMGAIASNEPLKLLFTCQNSCSGGINRKATSIVFTLENEFGQILGRKTMNFKVCSCPKRDKDKDEESISKSLPKKRKLEQTAPSTSKKVAIPVPVVKQESDLTVSMNSDPMMLVSMPSDLQSLTSGLLDLKQEQGSCDINITMPTQELKQRLLVLAYDMVSGELTRTRDAATLEPYLIDIQKQIGK